MLQDCMQSCVPYQRWAAFGASMLPCGHKVVLVTHNDKVLAFLKVVAQPSVSHYVSVVDAVRGLWSCRA